MSNPFNLNTDVVYGTAVRLAPQVRRLTVRNGTPMTFTGTQTYLVGEGEVAVIDPGPVNDQHVADVLNTLEDGEQIVAILLTHTHIDHSPGAAALTCWRGSGQWRCVLCNCVFLTRWVCFGLLALLPLIPPVFPCFL